MVAVHHRSVKVNDLDLHVALVPSDRPVLILIHGMGMDWRVWQSISRRIAPHFCLVMPDLRGHGESEKPPSGYGLADYASDIEGLLHAFQIKGATLVGSSLGGMIAIAVEAASDVVSRRVLVDPPLRRGQGPKRPLFLELLRIKRESATPHEQRAALLAALSRDDTRAGLIHLRYMAECWSVTSPGVLVDALWPTETVEDMAAALSALDVPTLIMRGNPSRGSVVDPGDAAWALQFLACGEEQYFPNAGHAIHGSSPAAFVDAVMRFSSHPGGLCA